MGTRHQIYIIANVLGRYRIVAVYHLQSLYPPEAVQMAWTVLQHIKQHAGPIEKELRCLREGRYTKNDAEYPCPCLGAVIFQRVQDCYGPYEGTYPERVNNNPWYQDNNSGYTVFDVTDPFSPAYCFWGAHDWYGFPSGDPIDPEGYATRYYVEEDLEFEDLKKEVQDAILALQGERFIGSRQTLDEAWDNQTRTLDEMGDDAPSQAAREFTEALRTVIKAGSTENAQKMADALSSTVGVVEGLRRALRQKKLPKCCDPVIVKGFLIAQDLSNSSELDLSWMQLSSAQVLKVVRAVLQDDSFKISSLNISGVWTLQKGPCRIYLNCLRPARSSACTFSDVRRWRTSGERICPAGLGWKRGRKCSTPIFLQTFRSSGLGRGSLVLVNPVLESKPDHPANIKWLLGLS